ncbi:hypothetical protein DM02DRAFT_513286 [Periconia macrospinosa]|uniref:Uncharacterized protein n=1 Tax=Periconia macrospinosa TaxID=97972 RepID=A0A2V1EAT1_9PLEO|nr:hypothetical protein DM02DRAFT_513286 [Periconia macrospinosa]
MSDRQPLIYHQTPESLDANTAPSLLRPGNVRMQSDTTAAERNPPSTVFEEDEDIAASFTPPPTSNKPVSTRAISRQPTFPSLRSPSITSPASLSPPNTGDFLNQFPSESNNSTPDLRRQSAFSPRDALKTSTTSLNDDYQQYLHSSETQNLQGAPSIKSAYETSFRPTQECPTSREFYKSRFSWMSITVVVICLFSTVFSGIFLGLAFKAPRYGRSITSKGSFKPADAILLTSVMAKMIELSFVTSFVAFLGQVLSRRAFMKEQGRGVTLSELSMWRWVVQPGTLVTHWETALYAGLSVLGILSLLSAILATLYTAAATALVQPMLKQGRWDNTVLAGRVKTEFANVNYLKKNCQTPVTVGMDKNESGNTCLQIEHAGQGYHNYQRYLSFWHAEALYGNGTTDQNRRPPGFGLLYENTTVIPQWINIIDTVEESKKHGRGINSVSLAMPHTGVFAAAHDQRNNILQPEELNSEGTYSIKASVPNPVLNVLCANMNREELKPIVYDEWPNGEGVTFANWATLSANATTKNDTVVDDLFGWTKQDDTQMSDYPPVFPRIPKAFNTILNHTSFGWNRSAIYLLGSGGPMDDGTDLNGTFALCKISVTLTAKCTTQYNATGSGGSMETLCEDKADHMTFNKSNTTATDTRLLSNWRDVGFDWGNAMSLNTGIMDAGASNSRLLTQLILRKNDEGNFDLSRVLPSPAEALAVMSGCTLLMSSLDSPFIMDWNYTEPELGEYQTQYFNASVIAQQYASGGVGGASKAWLVVLLLVFLMNIFVLVYFLLHRGLVTDFSEPPNLFALAVNSPPSHLLAGSCGGGPEGKQFGVNWFVNTEGDHIYLEPGQKPVVDAKQHAHHHSHHHHHHPHDDSIAYSHAPVPPPPSNPASKSSSWFTSLKSPFRKSGGGGRLRPEKQRLRPASVVLADFELEDGYNASKTQRQYAKLAKRTSLL